MSAGKARILRPIAALSSMLLVAGCTVGPEFHRPAVPKDAGYTVTPLSATSQTPNMIGGEAQRFVQGLDISGEWWTLFHSQALNELVERALKNSPDLKAAQAALQAARENVLAQRGTYYPGVTGSASVTRQKTSQEISPTPSSGALYFNLYTPQVSVAYVPDVFGLARRTVESLDAQTEQARFALQATQIALSANVTVTAIQEASLCEQIDATRHLIAVNSEMLHLLRTQFAKGYIGGLDVAVQETQLAQVTTTLPPLLKQLAQQRDLLAALTGELPNREIPDTFLLASLRLPQELPVSLPAQLVEQRPDVRQAEANLHAASARVGIAVANRLPNVTLTADAGSQALAVRRLFAGGAGFWDIGAGLTQPVFQGGMLLHQERAAKAAYVQAAEQYRGTVLTAFQNVADTLHALVQDADALQASAAAEQAATVSLEFSKKQWRSGYAGYLPVLNAEQAYQQAAINLIQARANRYTDTVALFQAVGGGWWNRTRETDASRSAPH